MFLGWGCIHTFPSLVGHEQLLPEPRTDPVSLINSSKTLNCLFSTNMTTETAALDANQLCLKWCGISYDCGSSLGKLIFLLMNWTRCNLTAEDARGVCLVVSVLGTITDWEAGGNILLWYYIVSLFLSTGSRCKHKLKFR